MSMPDEAQRRRKARINAVIEENIEQLLDDREQPARADVLNRRVHFRCNIGERLDTIIGDFERNVFCAEQGDILFDQACFRLNQNPLEVLPGQRLQFDADRQAALQLRQQVRWFGNVKCT